MIHLACIKDYWSSLSHIFRTTRNGTSHDAAVRATGRPDGSLRAPRYDARPAPGRPRRTNAANLQHGTPPALATFLRQDTGLVVGRER